MAWVGRHNGGMWVVERDPCVSAPAPARGYAVMRAPAVAGEARDAHSKEQEHEMDT